MQLSPVHTSWQSSGFLTCLLIFPFLQSCQKHSWICPKSSLLAQTSSNCYISLLSAIRQASIGLRDVHPDEVKTCPAIKAHQQIPVTEAPSFGSNACSSHKSAILILHSFLIEKSVTSPPEGTKTSLHLWKQQEKNGNIPSPASLPPYSGFWVYHWSQFLLLIFLLWGSAMSLWLGWQASSPLPDQKSLLPGKTLIITLFWH